MSVLAACVPVYHMDARAHKGQKGPEPSKLELWMVVSHYMGSGNLIRVPFESNKYF